MKKIFSKNWKNIIFIIGGVLLAIDLIFIITTPATISQDFLEYGPSAESDVFDGINNISGDMVESGSGSSLVDNVSDSTNIPPDIVKWILVFAVGFILIFIVSNIVEGSGGDSKKK